MLDKKFPVIKSESYRCVQIASAQRRRLDANHCAILREVSALTYQQTFGWQCPLVRLGTLPLRGLAGSLQYDAVSRISGILS